ncbi:MAG: glycosyltransferase family 2 protein [Acidobacteriota bacterium]
MISLVIPAFNEEAGIEQLYRRVTAAVPAWEEDYEVILVDDGSTDRTLEICEQLAAKDARFRVISLSRNFGQQIAVSAGLAHATGRIVSVMDADLQDPPEELLPFVEKIAEGLDVVYAIRTKRNEGLWKGLSYYVYYRILRRLATLDILLDSGDFCVMRAEVVAAINQLPERNRCVRGLRSWVGFRQLGLAYERQARYTGEVKYTFPRLLKLALDGIFNFSYRPLRLIAIVSMLVLVQYGADWTIAGFNPRQSPGMDIADYGRPVFLGDTTVLPRYCR